MRKLGEKFADTPESKFGREVVKGWACWKDGEALEEVVSVVGESWWLTTGIST